jgi:Domain of unknown function (DUF6456)
MARKKAARREPGADREPVSEAPGLNLDESPLAWLARRKDKDGQPMIGTHEFNAGEKLRADFTLATMTPRVTSNWSGFLGGGGAVRRGPPGHGVEIADHIIAANARVQLALKAVGPELSGILIDVCCHLKGLEALEKAAGWPQRSGKIVLQIALRKLARHYGLVRDGDGTRGGHAATQHWGAPDYRPEIKRDAG